MNELQRLASAYLRLMGYAMFMGTLGGIATFIGPPHHGLVKAAIGTVVGAMILGRRLPDAFKLLVDIMIDIADRLSRK